MSDSSGPSADDAPFVPTGDAKTVPAGAIGIPQKGWHRLKMTFTNDKGQSLTGFAYSVGQNASTSFWDYMAVNKFQSTTKFKFKKSKSGWDVLEIDDGNMWVPA